MRWWLLAFGVVLGSGCGEADATGGETDAAVGPCDPAGECPSGLVCAGGRCVEPLADSDGDGIAAASDCDDTDVGVGTTHTRACTAACGRGVEHCEAGRVGPCVCRDGGAALDAGGADADPGAGGADAGEAGTEGTDAGSNAETRCNGTFTGAFSLSTDDMKTTFTCPADTWCARMGNFIPASSAPPLYRNNGTYGGRTGYGAPGLRQRGLSMDPEVPSVVIQGGANVGWYYNTAQVPGTTVTYEHEAWDDPQANLATAYRPSTPLPVFPATGDGYAAFRFRYRIQTTNHGPGHPGCRLAGWTTFRDFGAPSLDMRSRPVIWIGVKPFDSTNPDATVGFTDGATRTPAFIFRQAITLNQIDPDQPSYHRAYLPRNDEHYGPFVQFDPTVPTDREFITEADGTWRTVAFRVYRANMQAAIDMARAKCWSGAPHPSCTNETTGETVITDDWSADPSDWRLVDVHLNGECPRREDDSGTLLANELGYTATDLAGGCVN